MSLHSSRRRWRGALQGRSAFCAFWQIRIQKAEHVRPLDCANAFLLLQIADALPKIFHFCPMHFRPEVVFGMIAVVEKEPVVEFSVAAYAPRDRLVRIRPIMAVVAVQITEAVA